MRRLVWFTIGFGIACGLCTYLLWNGNMPVMAFGALIFAVLFLFAGKVNEHLLIPALILLGCAIGFAWFGMLQKYYLFPAAEWDGVTEHQTITASDYSEKSLYGTSAEGTIELNGRPYRVLVYLKGDQLVSPGDKMEANFRIRLTTPGGIKESNYYQGKGIFLIGSQSGKELEIISPEEHSLRYFPARLGRAVRGILEECMPEDVLPFMQALLLGDSSGLDYETDTAFRISGIRHIIAVSGLHVAILFALVVVLCGNQRYLTAAVGMPVMVLFAAMAGFTPSVSRAAIMICLMMLARVLDREYDTPSELAFAGLVLLTVNPLSVTSVSFQLSVCSVSGILLFQRNVREWLEKRMGGAKGKGLRAQAVRWTAATVALTVSATFLSTPLSAYYFGTVSLITVVTNLLTVWVVGFLFYGILAVCGIGAVWRTGGILLGKVIAWPARYILFAAKWLAKVPLAAVYTKSKWITIWLICCYAAVILYSLTKRKRLRVYCAGAVGLLCGALMLSWLLPRLDDCRMTVLDVGQGQCILFQSRGHSFLVDCGGYSDTGAADTAAETLLSQGVHRLDGILLTHYDKDHMGGLPHLLTRVDADLLLLPFPEEDDFASSVEEQLHGEIRWVENEAKIPLGTAEITLLDCKTGSNGNENSVGILFETENCVILVTGDRNKTGEKALLDMAELPDVDVLIAGHHGSKNSTTDELLDAVKPETIIISVGAGNSYGHPAAEMLERAEKHGCTVMRTDEMGTILFRR